MSRRGHGPSSAFAVVRAATAHGLSAAPPVPAVEPGDRAWRDVIALAERQRVLGMLAAAAGDGAVVLDEAQQAELAEAHERWCVHDLRLERQLVHAASRLDDAGIPYLVLKGPALAHRWYPDPALRVFADLDLLVPSGHVHAATDVLSSALDATVALPELRPGFDERFGKEALLRTAATDAAPGGFEIDVHRTLVAGALGLAIPLDDLFVGTESVVIGGRSVPTLGAVPTFLLACYQATIADVPPRLSAARDVVEIIRSDRLDLDAAIEAARLWQARAVMADAVSWAWTTLEQPDRPPIVQWADRYRATRREQLLLASHRSAGHVYWRQLSAVLVLPGLEPRVRYLAAVLAPQGSYLDERQWSPRMHLRRAWRTLNRPVREPLVRWGRRLRRRYWLPR